ncbi:CDP-alcohol phosphatidyltransferase family protein [Nocardiopsis coralliicola]
MSTFTLAEVQERTYKPKDSWWTVWLVDPVASRLVTFVANRTSITPNQLTLAALVLGALAAACFAWGEWYALVTGVVLFHLSFVLDCMDGKIARLKGNGSIFGSWLDYVFDRLRVLVCAIALMGGQYAHTGEPIFLWFLPAIVFTDMFRYLNSPQMAKVRVAMRRHITHAIREAEHTTDGDMAEMHRAAGGFNDGSADIDHLTDGEGGVAIGHAERVQTPGLPTSDEEHEAIAAPTATRRAKEIQGTELQSRFHRLFPWYSSMRDTLRANRIRPHLFSGIEYQMGVFIVAPLIGVFSLTGMLATIAISAALMFAFELALIYKLWLSTRDFARVTTDINAVLASLPEPAQAEEQSTAA